MCVAGFSDGHYPRSEIFNRDVPMNNVVLKVLVQQLSYRIPVMLVCAFGFVLVLIYLRRCRLPAILTMIATGVMAATSLGTVLCLILLMQTQRAGGAGQDVVQYAQWMGLANVLSFIVHAAAIALLVIAVFVGRRSEDS